LGAQVIQSIPVKNAITHFEGIITHLERIDKKISLKLRLPFGVYAYI